MLSEKKVVSLDVLESETALELPSRETLQLVNVVVAGNTIQVPISVAANICGVAVNVLATALAQQGSFNNCSAAGVSVARA
jgi:ChpA-C